MYTLNKDSWHYRFAYMFSPYEARLQTNLCPYVRLVMKGLLLYILITTLIAGFAILNLMGIAGIIIEGMDSPFAGVPVITFGVVAVVLVVTFMHWLREQYDSWQHARNVKLRGLRDDAEYVPPQPGLIRLWWNSVHDKMCPQIELK